MSRYKRTDYHLCNNSNNHINVVKRGEVALKQKQYSLALTLFKKAANQNNAEAQKNLGIMYEEGYGVDINKQEALKWYSKAAEQDNAAALYKIGTLYEQGMGLARDSGKALDFYKRAAAHSIQ